MYGAGFGWNSVSTGVFVFAGKAKKNVCYVCLGLVMVCHIRKRAGFV